MKKICLSIILMFIVAVPKVQAVDIQTVLSHIGFNLSSQKDDKAEITKVLDRQQSYANKKNFAKLKTLYTSTYVNTDGIDMDSYIDSLEKTGDIHGKLKYKTIINNIVVNGDYATVEAVDIAEGVTKDSYDVIPGKGVLYSEAKAVYYFKKESGEWKIDSEMALNEKSYLKYGSAKEIEIKIDAPEAIKANTEYNIKVSANLPDGRGIIASITTEPIQYPHQKAEEIFRAMKKDGELERVVTSNSDGKNEVAFASVAIAKAVLNQESKLDFVIDGVAFISSRVNVIPVPIKKERLNEQEK
ncbi:hypothetical protein IJS77_05115 [bacterium]|nr:hypothetical protein [bacterium]